MKRRMIGAVIVLLLVVGGLAGVKVLQIRKMIATGMAYAVPPESVSSVVAREEKWQGTLDVIGSVAAVQGVAVTPEVAGTVREIAFESGALVSKGDLLVRLDTSSEDAQLRAVEAQVEMSRLNAVRTRQLRADKTVSESELDNAEAVLKQNQADADAIRATIDKKTIRAPFAGKLGIRQVNLGEYLDTGKPIVSLQSLSPVYVNFSLPQQELAQLATGMRVRVFSDAYADRQFEGRLTAINPDLDSSTRSIGLQATLDNPDQLLRPGMFVRVQVLLPSEQTVLVIPSTAVLSAPYGDSVYVIEPEPATNPLAPRQVVRQQFIRSGSARGDFVSVESGLKPGDLVVRSGLFKLRNGMAVVEHNDIVPKASEAPLPPDR